MVHKSVISFLTVLSITLGAEAGTIDGNAVLGSIVGAGVGSAVGSATGGKEGAIIGGGVGGALGAAVGSKNDSSRVVSRQQVIVVDEYHDHGRHKGHHKYKHGHGRD